MAQDRENGTIAWRWFSWSEALLGSLPAMVAALFARTDREYLLMVAVGVIYTLFQGTRHWLTARRGFRRIALSFDAAGVVSPLLSDARVPWRSITAIEAPTGWSRTAVLRVSERSLIRTARFPDPLSRFKPPAGKAVLLSGWKLDADMAAVASEMEALRKAAIA